MSNDKVQLKHLGYHVDTDYNIIKPFVESWTLKLDT